MSESHTAPIVLVHGILGFSKLALAGMTIANYFRLIPEALRNAGHLVPDPPALNPAGSIAERAQDLKNYLFSNADVAGRKVHIIAHSMGGLDSRYMISKLGMADRVLSVTTITTPHHGSPLADIIQKGAGPLLNKLSTRLGVDVKGAADLTTDAGAQFNKNIPDVAGISYSTISAQFDPPLIGPGSLARFAHDIIEKTEGANDGLVSVQSAKLSERPGWTALDVWQANHFRVINWGTDIVPSKSELKDNSIIEKYLWLAGHVKALVS